MSRVDEALWRHHANQQQSWQVGDGERTTVGGDLRTLADEYVKLRDTTPITEEFAAKLGILKHNRYQVYMSYDRLEGRWYLQIMDGDWSEFVGYATTCGQVRCLLLAAGIECDA